VTAFQAGCRAFASRGLAPCIRLWREKRARSASFALPAASQVVPTFWPPPAQVRACHLLLESPVLARAGRLRRGWFTCHEMRAHVVSQARGNHLASAWSADGEPGPTHDRSSFQPFPALCPGARRCRTTLIGYACGVPTRPVAHDGPSAFLPCTCRHGAGKRQGKVEGQVGTTCICKLSRLSGRHLASVGGTGPVPLPFLPSTRLLDMKYNAMDRFMRDPIRCCHSTERFVFLYHPMNDHRPVFSGDTVLRVFWPWTPLANYRRRAGVRGSTVSEHLLHLEIQCARRGKEEGTNW